MKKVRLFTIGLALSLAFTQTAQAAIFITPFGTTQVYQGEAPGEVETQQEQTTPQPSQVQQEVNVALETSTEGIGPGAVQPEISVVLPSAVYSTKEPVTVKNVQTAGLGVSTSANQNSQAGTAQSVQAPQAVQTAQSTKAQQAEQGLQGGQASQAVLTGTITDLEKAAVAAEITIPTVSAEGAILYDVTHDRIVFEKNADKKFYPASITKLLTALLVLEHAKLDETVTYSKTAVTNLESGAVTLQLQEGDKVSVKDSLYGLMLRSANEVANGLAEHVGGTVSGFADMMNAKAKALGCTGSNFVNPNGLNHEEHYTTARDMAKIAKAAFANETLCKITSTISYQFPETKAAKARTISMGHKMLYKSDSRYYDGIVGGKTGYTSLAGNTLVTCVERDGVRMIAVILKSRSTHYTDTKALLDYGFALSKAGILDADGIVSTNEQAGQRSTQSSNVEQMGPGSTQSSNTEQMGPGYTQSSNTAQMGPWGANAGQDAANVQQAGPGGMQNGNVAQTAGPGAAQQEETTTAYHQWIADGDVWRFELADGTRLSNCLVTIDGSDYAFDTEGKMVTGWLTLGENWHYFSSSGAMIKGGWRQDDSLWFYLGDNGAMVKNAWIDNQYYVGGDGVWVQ